LNSLKNAKTGIYCSPLRLLAFEIYQTLNSEDVKCSLVTGEEFREIPESTHISSTMEMANISQIFDVAIIDEIQMIGDLERGFAWTNAVLGLNASEIHLCGDSSCVNLIKKICQTTGEELVVKEYKRLNELVFEESSLKSSWKLLKPRDCVIAFTRKDSKNKFIHTLVFTIKESIESTTNFKCCIIYGGLPSETRLEQSDLFNDLNSGYSILIATDAIGMGLNLNIKRIIFFQLRKFDGISGVKIHFSNKKNAGISLSLFKQISGRAGRKSFYDKGYVTTFSPFDHEMMKKLSQKDITGEPNIV
jgi:ATP-dependent RNA helicase SUPV3L1/SUV3